MAPIDYRLVQRTLFRMQLDPAFAADVLRDGPAAAALSPVELGLLVRAGLAAISADHRGRRRAQVLGNLSSEYVLTLAEAARGPLGAGFVDAFPSSQEFHDAIAGERSLPLAFGGWASDRARAAGAFVVAALAALESAMACARREDRPAPAPPPGAVALSASARLVELPAGLFGHALALREALDAGGVQPQPAGEAVDRARQWFTEAGGTDTEAETVLLVVAARPGWHRLREVAPELLDPEVARLLRATIDPLDGASLRQLADASDWSVDAIGKFVDHLVADGILLRG